METFENPDIDPQEWTWSPGAFTHRYGQEFSYDPNGNILSQTRLDHSGSPSSLIDQLQYHYYPGTNQLEYVTNSQSGGANNQVPDQDPENYLYDGSGNMIQDCSESLSSINWNHFGKVKMVRKNLGHTNSVINFGYNPNQQRVKKQIISEVLVDPQQSLPESFSCISQDPVEPSSIDTLKTLWYIRDATGNVLAV
ncbi:MAG: hypothetical protein EA409_09450 [Saprospirales bacterium]|nr:MAG: hypothetical protein EA409_09450 [Saprospirales bacterium]